MDYDQIKFLLFWHFRSVRIETFLVFLSFSLSLSLSLFLSSTGQLMEEGTNGTMNFETLKENDPIDGK